MSFGTIVFVETVLAPHEGETYFHPTVGWAEVRTVTHLEEDDGDEAPFSMVELDPLEEGESVAEVARRDLSVRAWERAEVDELRLVEAL